MKQLQLLILGFLLTLMISCQGSKDFEGIRPDVRLQEELTKYEDQLQSAEHGWIAYLFPASGGGYTFKIKFDQNNRVNMQADYDNITATTYKESSYRLKAAQVPCLYFDTYTYIHQLADPDPLISGGVSGKGRYSDFEFSIVSASTDSVRLQGNLNGSELLLVRAEVDQGDTYIEEVKNYSDNQLAKFDQFRYYYNIVTVGIHKFQFTLNREIKTVSFRGIGAIDSIHFITEYAVDANGILLRNPLKVGFENYHRLNNIDLDIAEGRGSFSLESVKAELVNQPNLATRNQSEALQMYNLPYQYFSRSGFYKDGKEDALNLNAIPGFLGVQYHPRKYIDADIFYVYYNNGVHYAGPSLRTDIDPQGIMRFTDLKHYEGFVGNGIPQASYNKIEEFTNLILANNGYYVYKIGNLSYDLVAVDDARIWIRFN